MPCTISQWLSGLALILTIALFSVPVPAQNTSPAPSAARYDVDPHTGLRMERYRAPVPGDVPGGITLDTADVFARQGDGTLVFIDVYPPTGLGPDPLDGHWVTSEKRRSIPGTSWLPEVGRGTLSAEAEDYFRRNLARLTRNSPATPVLFFCTADCWQSWNAARRAINWGYTAVYWYPLGTDGWEEAGHTLAPVQAVNFLDDTTPGPESETTSEMEPDTEPDAATSGFPDTAGIYLIDRNDTEVPIGRVDFTAVDNGQSRFTVEIDSPALVDQFLSMRPFRCLTGDSEWFCHLPYPYQLHQRITPDDLTELAYQLLFLWKSPDSFGIDAWNGVYYRLTMEADGSIRGALLQGDLNVLASPPEPYSHPLDPAEFIEEGADRRLYPALVIRP
jgi:PQQ-dependent catabolism-associated CXXCW motif protein